MNRFDVISTADLEQASKLLTEPFHSAIAGGVDLLDLLKQRVIGPKSLVNLKTLAGMDTIDSDPEGGVKLGALVKLHQVAEHRVIRANFTALSQAAGEAATPQIRNLGTVGGNLLQRPRCWYFRNPDVVCLKKGGDTCYAAKGLNRYHAILGGGPSFIVHPSNLAPALIAFGASAKLVGPAGERIVALDRFFILPSTDPSRENILQPGEIITHIVIPPPPRNARSIYLEVREKQSFDWPLVSVAAVVATDNAHTVRNVRVVMGAVAPIPWRSPEAEKAVLGSRLDAANATRAADAALHAAAPLADNRYKVPMAKALVRRALMRAGGIEEVT
jgi:xanthine dehydrogenase YagS FAD-binding subunit